MSEALATCFAVHRRGIVSELLGSPGGFLWLVLSIFLLAGAGLVFFFGIVAVRLQSELQLTVIQMAADVRRIADRQP